MNEEYLKVLNAVSQITGVSVEDILRGPKVPRTMTARVLATHELWRPGRSYRVVSRIMGVSCGTVGYRLKQYRSWIEFDFEFQELAYEISTIL